MAELLHVARDIDRTIMIKSVNFLCFLQQLHEQRMINVDHRHDNSLWLLPFAADHNRKAALGDVSQRFFFPMMISMMMTLMMEMEVEIDEMVVIVGFIAGSHGTVISSNRWRVVLLTVREKKAKDQKPRWQI